MMEFEKAKMGFGSSDFDTYEISPLALNAKEGSYDPSHYDKEERAVILSKWDTSYPLSFELLTLDFREDMRQLFTPVVGGILRLLSHQIDLAMKDKNERINVSPEGTRELK